MGSERRKGKIKLRAELSSRPPELGYYLIFTNTEETEENYFNGLRDRIPVTLSGRIVVNVCKLKPNNIINQCLETISREVQIRKGWLIIDRDEVKEFDNLIFDAEKNGINVGWSNPCFEIWLHSYFGKMPVDKTSMLCCRKFEDEFEKKTNQKYQKSDQKIYDKLIQFGDEKKAIITARKRHSKSLSDFDKPSEMLSTSKVYVLVDEIVKIIENN